MTYYGAPDWQDPTQPQAGGDALGGGAVAVGQNAVTVGLSQALGQYKRYLITGSVNNACIVTCTVTDTFTSMEYQFSRFAAAGGSYQFALPSFGVVGDQQVDVTIFLSINNSGFPAAFNVLGLRQFPDLYRLDGLPPCTGSLTALQSASSMASAVLIPAPTAPARILLGDMYLTQAAVSGSTNLQADCTVNGTTSFYGGIIFGGNQNQFFDYGEGILLDPGSGVQLENFITSTGIAVCHYDIVPT